MGSKVEVGTGGSVGVTPAAAADKLAADGAGGNVGIDTLMPYSFLTGGGGVGYATA